MAIIVNPMSIYVDFGNGGIVKQFGKVGNTYYIKLQEIEPIGVGTKYKSLDELKFSRTSPTVSFFFHNPESAEVVANWLRGLAVKMREEAEEKRLKDLEESMKRLDEIAEKSEVKPKPRPKKRKKTNELP